MTTQQKTKKPIILIIRDGWGVSPDPKELAKAEGNAVLLARTPVHDKILAECPWNLLGAAGEAVGLPPGQMGNSEVGHLNLGAGRIVYQDFTRISLAIKSGTFFQTPAFLDIIAKVKARGGRLHLMGLCSDGGVHSHLEHLYALIEMAHKNGLSNVLVHCIMDGRDTSPTSGADYIAALQARMAQIGAGQVATVIGRYYAMDRDKRWERVRAAYNAYVKGEGVVRSDPVAATRDWYQNGKTDEFIPPTVIASTPAQQARNVIADGDGVIFFNFRSDRAREITSTLTDPNFKGFDRGAFPKIDYVCMTEYDESFTLPVAFPPMSMRNILTQVLAANKLRQLRIAETEKYAHVTFFFSGGVEEPVEGEDRCLIPSPKVATYDLQPEMSAPEVTRQVVEKIRSGVYDVIVLNFANADMVGHTGIVPAAIKAIETVDSCVGQVVGAIKEMGGVALITADHGNAEKMIEDDGSPFTAHTTNKVEFIYVADDMARWKVRDGGILADVAPTILTLLHLPIPAEMTGKSLLEAK